MNRNNILLGLFLFISFLISDENAISKDFQPAGRMDAMIDKNSKNLKLIQLNLKNDSIFHIINENFPRLELFGGPASYHRIVSLNQLNQIQEYIIDADLSVLNNEYVLPDESRLYWFEIKPGSQTYGINDEIEYTCDCIEGASDCVKLGWDDGWYNPFDYYAEAWYAYAPPNYQSIEEIRVTVTGAQCDALPVWSEP